MDACDYWTRGEHSGLARTQHPVGQDHDPLLPAHMTHTAETPELLLGGRL
jgi:hypothetical protein